MKYTVVGLLGLLLIGMVVCVTSEKSAPVTVSSGIQAHIATSTIPHNISERYSARVDRVDVVFEQTNYTHYRLQTNGLVREGDLNTERGYRDDPDATVYVLNWQQPVGQQMRYVRLTSEPDHLYFLDSENSIVRGSRLIRENK